MGGARLFSIGLALAASASGAFAQGALELDLRHSQLCAKAARDFQGQPQWKDQDATFTSHFNKHLGKCLVKVSRSDRVKNNSHVLETEHVYDALEGVVLGGKITTKALAASVTGEPKVLGTLMIRDGKMLGNGDPGAALEAIQWFSTLMVD